MSGDLSLREIETTDFDAIHRLLTELHAGEDPWRGTDPQAAAHVLDQIVADPWRRLRLACIDGEAVGMVDTLVVPNLTRDARPWAVIENMVVLPGHRRRGIGRALVEDAMAFAEHHRAYKIQLVSAGRRGEAHTFYASLGFDAEVRGFRRYLDPPVR